MKYTNFYVHEVGFKLQSVEEKVFRVSLEECAQKCTQSKRCTCSSFSYNAANQRCLLGNRNIPFDSLISRKAWTYYSLNHSLDNGCNRNKRPATIDIEGLRLVPINTDLDLVQVKINQQWGGVCDDGFSENEANVICRQLG